MRGEAKFPTLTGRDCGRLIRLARLRPNAVRQQIAAEIARRREAGLLPPLSKLGGAR